MIQRRAHIVGTSITVCIVSMMLASSAQAQDREISHVGEIVNVIDASDGEDRFDFTFRAGYEYNLTRVKITQQCPAGMAGSWSCVPGENGVIAFRDVGRYNHIQHILNLQATFGLFRDLEIYTNWPIILQDRRELVDLEDNPNLDWYDNRYLLRFPFQAADRFGVDQFSLGVSYLPFSQERNPTLPTWLVNFEAEIPVGDPMQPACRDGNGAVAAADGSTQPCNTDGGISERHWDIILRMTLSRRVGIIEPYIGFMFEAELPEESDSERYGAGGYNYPLYAEAHFGFELVPWERNESQQYFRLAFHVWGGWNRESLIYSPLYDVLGTNPNMQSLFEPALSSSDTPETFVPTIDRFSGLTRIEGHGTFGGRLTLVLQVARYVKFLIGASIAHDQEHFITFSDQCRNPRGNETGSADGPGNYECTTSGTIFEDDWRPQIDRIGRRFRAEETTIFNAFVDVNIQF